MRATTLIDYLHERKATELQVARNRTRCAALILGGSWISGSNETSGAFVAGGRNVFEALRLVVSNPMPISSAAIGGADASGSEG